MKKMTLKMWLLGGFVAIASLCATSCTEGADCDERWESEVSNAQLESPAIDASCIEIIANADGSETAKFTWPMVVGAGGFEVKVANINDPANPVYLVDTLIDGQTVTFPNKEETDYTIAVRTLGNEARNNKAATTASEMAYTTWLPNTTVPAGSELSTFIAENLATSENIIRLLPGAEYSLSAPANFGMTSKILSGNADDRPIVKVTGEGCIMTQAGLTVKNIAFDCSEEEETKMTAIGLIAMDVNPSETISATALGFKDNGANQDAYHVMDPIVIVGCWVKNLPHSLFYDSQKAYAVWDLQIMNNIIQMNNSGGNGVINFQKAGKSIKDMQVFNNTFYNLVTNSSAYFIRFNNASNAQPQKVYPASDATSLHVWKNNTFAKTFTGKDFGNNTPQKDNFTIEMENNNFYDVFRLYQYLHNNATTKTLNNAICYKDGSPQSSDYGGRLDDTGPTKKNDGNPFATLEETPFFDEPADGFPALDLTQPNGGVNFKATGALSSTIGDPRWL